MNDQEQDVELHEDDEVKRVSRPGTLEKFIRSKIEGRITSEARDTFLDQLEQIAIILINRAQEICKENNRLTIKTSDFDQAYEDLMNPHVFIEKIIDTLEKQKEDLRVLAEHSLLRHMEVEM